MKIREGGGGRVVIHGIEGGIYLSELGIGNGNG